MLNTKRVSKEINGISFLFFILFFSVSMIYPVVKSVVIDIHGADVSTSGVFVSLNLLAYAVFSTIWGSLSDKTGRRKVFIVTGFLGNSVLLFLQPFSTGIPMLLLLRFLEGIFTVMAYSICFALVVDISKKENYGKGMGIAGTGIALGMTLGVPAGGITGNISPSYPFFIASALLFLAMILSIVIIDKEVNNGMKKLDEINISLIKNEIKNNEIKTKNDVNNSFSKDKNFHEINTYKNRKDNDLIRIVAYSFSFTDRFTAGFFISIFTVMLGTTYDMEPIEISIYLFLFLLPFSILQYPGGLLIDKKGFLRPRLISATIYGFLVMMVGIISPPLIAVVLIISGIMASVMLPASAALCSFSTEKKHAGKNMGGFVLAGTLGFAIGPAVAGFIAKYYSFFMAFFIAGVVVILNTLFSIAVLKIKKVEY